MALGKRRDKQPSLFYVASELPQSPGHPFYHQLNQLLGEAGFDAYVENLCQPYYADGQGRPGLPPGLYFRMLFIGYFEGLDSQRGIAWRCADSRSLQAFLGLLPNEATPDHSSLTRIRQRLPEVVHEQVFAFVLQLADQKGLIRGKTVAVDATTLEANAAMKSICRKDNGDDYHTYLKKLAQEAGLDNPSDEELRRFDQKRKDKKVSNQDWQSATAPDSRIAKMKDGTTHLAYKAEHVVDLDSDLVLAAEVHPADQSDSATLQPSVATAQLNLLRAGSEQAIEEVVADKGYHKLETLAETAEAGYRTYIPEAEQPHDHVWTDKLAEQQKAYRANRRRVKGKRGKRLQKKRSEYVERSFAHVCETGGGRRSWLRGLVEVSKRYLMQVAAHNLGVILRQLFGVGTPRSLQGKKRGEQEGFAARFLSWWHQYLGRYRSPTYGWAVARGS